jgi:glutamine amidotransferase
MLALIDYGAGNLTSVKKALATIGADVVVPTEPGRMADAAGVIVPGVGHFGATRALTPDWIDAILQRVGEGRPLLGICLGMQWLFEGSDEAPDCRGLGLLAGQCFRLGGVALPPVRNASADRRSVDEGGRPGRIKVPHVGWNSLDIRCDAPIAEGIASGAQVYFTHSYVAPVTSDTVAVTEHGEPFAAIVQHGQVVGVQFHPEKSGEIGLKVLRNFVDMTA